MTRVLPSKLLAGLFLLYLTLLLPGSIPVYAQQQCTGYNPDSQHWGIVHTDLTNPLRSLCSSGMAVVYHLPVLGAKKNPALQPVSGSCCPMPAGSLTQRQEFHPGACPENSVVTGSVLNFVKSTANYQEYLLRCTFIDTEKFYLAPPQPTLRLEYGNLDLSSAIGKAALTTGRNMLPDWLRQGIARQDQFSWFTSGCIGFPWGSAMTAMTPSGCSAFVFQEIKAR